LAAERGASDAKGARFRIGKGRARSFPCIWNAVLLCDGSGAAPGLVATHLRARRLAPAFKLDAAFRTIKGVADRTVARLIAELPEIGTASNKAIAKLAGVAPPANQSGNHDESRHIEGGQRLALHPVHRSRRRRPARAGLPELRSAADPKGQAAHGRAHGTHPQAAYPPERQSPQDPGQDGRRHPSKRTQRATMPPSPLDTPEQSLTPTLSRRERKKSGRTRALVRARRCCRRREQPQPAGPQWAARYSPARSAPAPRRSPARAVPAPAAPGRAG